MPSQIDLDQGGSFRQFVRRYLGPSIGWVNSPDDNVVPITAAGTTTVLVGTTLVTVNVNGNVTVQLPSAKASVNATAGALPGLSLALPITIVDIGGFAGANPITIQPASSSENILGEAQVQITAAYGGFSLNPSNAQKGWTNPQ